MTYHQKKQIETINQIEKQIKNESLQASTVSPVKNYDTDPRICLTSVHFPKQSFINNSYATITDPLKKLFPEAYFYTPSSLHFTIKNIRIINNPPRFTEADITVANEIFTLTIPLHQQFFIYPYKLLLFKNSLSLMCTSDEELDHIILDLNRRLTEAGIQDDKQYANSSCFFCNMTIARFNTYPPHKCREMIETISSTLNLPSYCIDSVSLVSANAAMKKLTIFNTWKLNKKRCERCDQ